MNRIGLAGLVISFILLLAAFGFVIWGFSGNQRASDLVVHTFGVKDMISDVSRDLERAESARRGYMIDASPRRLQTYDESAAQLLPTIDALEQQTIDNPVQLERVKRVRPLVENQIRDMEQSIALVRSGNRGAGLRSFQNTGNLESVFAIRQLASEIEDEEDRLLTQRLAAERRALQRVQILLVIVGIALLVASIGTMWMLRRYTNDLLASRARLHVLNTNLEGVVDERTAGLRRANEEIQRFAYIVSHDLRSPLVNVLGFTAELEAANKAISDFVDKVEADKPELVDENVRFAAKEDLPEAIGFIRTSTQKMDRLINAILNLSRQGRRVLAPEHLVMDQLVGDISDSLASLAAEREATIVIETPLPDLNHDRLAIEQIFQNLIENATKYLKPGTPGTVVIRGNRNGRRVAYEIEDDGRGISPHDHERIFDLFRRSGAQDQRGEGIGLAHVRSLAYRLGGTVTVASTLNEGATFTVDLPVAFEAEKDEE
jgi:signal transduction histidine kinase